MRQNMNFIKLCNVFVNNCFLNKIVFSEADIIEFAKVCNVKADYQYLRKYVSSFEFPNYNMRKSLLGPCIFHPTDIMFKDVKYNTGKIIKDLQLSNQNIPVDDKMQKIVDYIKFI